VLEDQPLRHPGTFRDLKRGNARQAAFRNQVVGDGQYRLASGGLHF
jgi:hypothetical protein